MPNKLSQFWQDLKRRKVILVLTIYSGVAIVLIGLADDVTGPINLPEGLKRTHPYETVGSDENENQKTVPRITHNNSVGVLPFEEVSPDKDQAYFCEGIAEEIINSLTQVKRLKVIARTSPFAFKGKQMDIRKIGNTPDVANVLKGSIRKDGGNMPITAQLIRVEDGYQMFTPEGTRKAQENYRKAIEEDPEYSLANAAMGSNIMDSAMYALGFPDEAITESLYGLDKYRINLTAVPNQNIQIK